MKVQEGLERLSKNEKNVKKNIYKIKIYFFKTGNGSQKKRSYRNDDSVDQHVSGTFWIRSLANKSWNPGDNSGASERYHSRTKM